LTDGSGPGGPPPAQDALEQGREVGLALVRIGKTLGGSEVIFGFELDPAPAAAAHAPADGRIPVGRAAADRGVTRPGHGLLRAIVYPNR